MRRSLVLAVLAGCRLGDLQLDPESDLPDVVDTDPDVDPVDTDTDLVGARTTRFLVRDPDGGAVPGAQVVVGDRTAATDDDGLAVLVDLDGDGARDVDVRAPGYAPGRTRIVLGDGDATFLVTLAPVDVATLGSAAAGGTVASDGLDLAFPPDAIVAAGSSVSGPVEVRVAVVDVADLDALPPLTTATRPLDVGAAFEVSLVAAGAPANLGVDVPFTLDVGRGAPVLGVAGLRLFTFDLGAGVWVDLGAVTVDADAGTVSGVLPHLSWFALGHTVRPADLGCVTTTVTLDGVPLGGVEVTARSGGYRATATTAADGTACVEAIAAKPVRLRYVGTSADGQTVWGRRRLGPHRVTGGAVCDVGCADAGTVALTADAPLPGDTADTASPSDTQVDPDTDLPVDTDTDLPADTDSDLPGDTDTDPPVDTDTDLPVDTDTDPPADTGLDTGPLADADLPRHLRGAIEVDLVVLETEEIPGPPVRCVDLDLVVPIRPGLPSPVHATGTCRGTWPLPRFPDRPATVDLAWRLDGFVRGHDLVGTFTVEGDGHTVSGSIAPLPPDTASPPDGDVLVEAAGWGFEVPSYPRAQSTAHVTLVAPPSTCGDGQPGPLEACDDGNLHGLDGCGTTCAVEPDLTGVVQEGRASVVAFVDDGRITPTCFGDVVATWDGAGNMTVSGACTGGEDDLVPDGPVTATLTADGLQAPGVAGVAEAAGRTFWAYGGATRLDPYPDLATQLQARSTATVDGRTVTWVLSVELSDVPTTCGDGVYAFPEWCDDGNDGYGDGCDPGCRPGFDAQYRSFSGDVALTRVLDPDGAATTAACTASVRAAFPAGLVTGLVGGDCDLGGASPVRVDVDGAFDGPRTLSGTLTLDGVDVPWTGAIEDRPVPDAGWVPVVVGTFDATIEPTPGTPARVSGSFALQRDGG